MRVSVLVKLILSYILFALLGFIVVFNYSGTSLRNNALRTEAKQLYSEATAISDSYATDYYNSDSTLVTLHQQLAVLSGYLNATIRVVNTSGKVIADSSQALTGEALEISEFDPSDFGSKYYMTGLFYNTFSEIQLSVIAPITINYKVRGYITIHKSVSEITKTVDHQLNIFYISFVLILASGLVALLLVILTLYRPMRKISKIARAYGSGYFENKTGIEQNDELGTIAASLDSMAYELDNLENDQRKFISNISHDFRSPLTSIRGYANAMLDGTIPVELQGKYLDIIVFETERLTKLTENLLDLNKLGVKGMILDISKFDVNEVIKQTCASFEGTCREKNLTIDLILTGQTMYVSADIDKIRQVFYNLIDNAIKFSHNDSSVTVETTERSGKIYVAIKDSGIGIPKDSINKVWERFYKTDQSRGKDKKGTGLGLAIVKEIINAHNENINVISTENVGTEFVFTLPIAEE